MTSRKIIEPTYLTPHYSTKLCRSYYNYLSLQYNKSLFYEVCEELEVPPEFLLQDNNWYSHEFDVKFISRIKQKTGDPEIAKRVGETLLAAENINPLEIGILRLLPPYFFFLQITKAAAKVNRYSAYKALKTVPGHIVLKINSKIEAPHDIDTCLNAEGAFSAPAKFYGLDPYVVQHTKCIHRGDDECVFDIRYGSRRYYLRRFALLFIAASGAVMAGVLTHGISNTAAITEYLAIIIYLMLGAGLYIFSKVRGIFKYQNLFYEQSKIKERALYDSKLLLDRRYREANMQRDLSMTLVSQMSSKNVVETCVNELEKHFGYERILVMLINANNTELKAAEVRGFRDHQDMLFKLSLPYPATKEGPQLFANILAQGDSTLVTDIEEYKKGLEPMNQLLISAFNVKNLIICPIQDSEKKYGILAIGALGSDRQLNVDDQHLVENVTRMLAIFFKQARTLENERTLKSVFQKYVPSVVMDNIQLLEAGHDNLSMPKNNAITSMFIDLRDFTKTSEMLPPERLVEMLNAYIDHTTEIIASHGGIIDNLVGDGIVSFFPSSIEHRTLHAKKALVCAIDILSKLSELNERLQSKGLPRVRIGIGMHSGNATVGNVGGRVRVNYTAIGDTVNVAARLEGMCKELAHKAENSELGLIILSESVLRRAPLLDAPVPAGAVHVRGREDALNVYLIDAVKAEKLIQRSADKLFQVKETAVLSTDIDGEQSDPGTRIKRRTA